MAAMVYYAGRVQGVGFRATVANLARHYPVTGWVKNLPDGRVQLLADGPPDGVRLFLGAVRQRFAGHIEAEDVLEYPSGGHTGFSVVG